VSTPHLHGPIRAVLFDVDGTLYRQMPLRTAMACEMTLAHVWSVCTGRPGATRKVLAFRSTRESLREVAGAGEPLAARQYSAAAERLGCEAAEVERAVEEWMYRRPLKWLSHCQRRGLTELLDFLASRGVRCGVFSDYPAHAKLDALGLGDRFDLVLSATDPEVGVFKPDPRGFVVAAERWGMAPEDVLYVGDRPDVDAAGASAAGMQCVVLANSARVHSAGYVPVPGFKELQRALSPVC
jgi:putative hydrolase of the HAD superfamily